MKCRMSAACARLEAEIGVYVASVSRIGAPGDVNVAWQSVSSEARVRSEAQNRSIRRHSLHV